MVNKDKERDGGLKSIKVSNLIIEQYSDSIK